MRHFKESLGYLKAPVSKSHAGVTVEPVGPSVQIFVS